MSPSYCYRCSHWFSDAHALSQHERDSPKHLSCYCNFCNISFASLANLRRHYRRKHYYCNECDEPFDDSDDFLDHGEEEHYACRSCIEVFATYNSFASHNESSHYYCRSCNRFFSSQSNQDMHYASSIHAPRWLACPAHQCGKAFCSVSALLHHAESNTCPSGVTRETVNKYVAKIDKRNIITNPSRMIAGPGGTHHPPKEPNYLATERSWNGAGYECFLCETVFKTLDSLNQHLKSPRHLQRIYHCPMHGCNMEFTVLSALCQHVEMGSCGMRQTRMILDAVGYFTRGMKALTF